MTSLSGKRKTVTFIVCAAMLFVISGVGRPAWVFAEIVADHTRTAVIPDSAVNLAKSTLHIAYGHTSHGSQLVTGMSSLMAHNALYSFSSGGSGGSLDLRDYAMGGMWATIPSGSTTRAPISGVRCLPPDGALPSL